MQTVSNGTSGITLYSGHGTLEFTVPQYAIDVTKLRGVKGQHPPVDDRVGRTACDLCQ
jgi:hypothetical protein